MPPKRRVSQSRPASGRGAALGRVWWMLPLLWLVTLAIYYPAWHGGMLWDDPAHLTKAALRSVAGLERIWTDVRATQQYYPVVHTSFWIMDQLWGHDTFGYHLVNILLHGTSAFLFGLILRRLSVPGAWLAAFLFAVHPIQAESVAWMTELKNALSGVFYLAAALTYLRFDENRRRSLYAIALGLFILALLSKTVTATLPAALLVVIWWQRGRILWRTDVVPLLPFFVAGLASGAATAWIERTLMGAEGAEFQFTIIDRGLIAGRVVWFYLTKQFWPANLMFMYPRWHVSQRVWWQYLFPLGVVALVAVGWWWRRRSRAPLATVLLYVGALFPALGFFNVYVFRYAFVANRFQYLASLPILAAVAAVAATLTRRWTVGPARRAMLVFALSAPLAGLTWQQARQYADSTTLYNATIARNPDCWLCYANLAADEMEGPPNQVNDAIAHLRLALQVNPDGAAAHNALGVIWQRMGRLDDAVREQREAVRLSPDLAEAHYDLGLDLQIRGQFEDAILSYDACLRLDPTNAKARHNLANALQAVGRVDEAVAQLGIAVQLAPETPEIWENLGIALLRLGRAGEAVAPLQQALRLKPDSAEMHNNLGLALQRTGQTEAALAEFREGARLMPGSVQILRNLGEAFLATGKPADAVVVFQGALALEPDPNRPDLCNMMGLAEVRLGRREAAVAHFREALRLRPDFPSARANLAAALAMK